METLHKNKTNIKLEALEIDGIMKTDPDEILKEVESYFQKMDETKPNSYLNKKNVMTKPKFNSNFEKYITFEEVERAIQNLKNEKSGGRENIPNDFFLKRWEKSYRSIKKII